MKFLSVLPRRLLLSAMGAAAVLGAAPVAWAQNAKAWPSQPIKLVVGFPAGTSPDLMARTLAEPLAEVLGQPVVVDNRPGAGGNIGAAQVARATDGHTFGLMVNGNLTIAKILNPATPYDPITDLAPVSLIAVAPLVLTAPNSAPVGGSAFWSAAKASGDRWNYGSPGIGTVAHLGMELIKAKAGISPVHVPYAGNPAVITGMLGEQVHMALLPPGLAMVQVQAGKLRAVGVTSAGRSAVVPGVPSLSESGLPGVELEIWNAVAAPRQMPQAHIVRLASALTEIVRRPGVRAQIVAQGWQVVGTAPQGLANRIAQDTAIMSDVIQRNGIQAR